MNDMSPADDELLSSYLDGEATPEGIARIESDPTLQARVEELRAARDLIAAPVAPLPAPAVDDLIAAALEASATSPVVTGIEQARRRRSDRARTIVAVAAGVLLLAIAVPVLDAITSDSGNGSSDTASVALDSDDDTGDDDSGDDSFSLEALPADDTSVDDDMADADSADDDSDAAAEDDALNDAGGDAEGAADPAAASQHRAGLFSIEPVLDEVELENVVRDRLHLYADATAFDEDRLDVLPAFVCAEELEFLIATDEFTLVDSGVTAVGGTATAVVLVRQGDTEDYVLYATPLETCTPITILHLGD